MISENICAYKPYLTFGCHGSLERQRLFGTNNTTCTFHGARPDEIHVQSVCISVGVCVCLETHRYSVQEPRRESESALVSTNMAKYRSHKRKIPKERRIGGWRVSVYRCMKVFSHHIQLGCPQQPLHQ